MANVSFRSPQQNRRGRKRLFFATLLVIVLLIANYATHGDVSAAARSIAAPLWGGVARAGDAIGASGFFSSKSTLVARAADLQNQLAQREAEAAAFSVLQQKYDALASLTHLAQTNPGRAVPVTSSFISSPYGTFTIGAGSDAGITPGASVLTGEGFVVGTVVQVSSGESLVQETFAPGVQTNVIIDGIAGIALGQGGDARVDLPHGSTIAVGDPVLAPELRAHPIGIVAHIDANPANAQTILYVSYPVSLSTLQFVYVTP